VSREQLLKNIEINYHKLKKITSAKIVDNTYSSEGEIDAIPRKTVPNSGGGLPVNNMLGAFGNDKIQFMYGFEFSSGSLGVNIHIKNTTTKEAIVQSGRMEVLDWDTGELIGISDLSEHRNSSWHLRGDNEWHISGLMVKKKGAGRKLIQLKSSEVSKFKYRFSAVID
jgi:hypothetical protein